MDNNRIELKIWYLGDYRTTQNRKECFVGKRISETKKILGNKTIMLR